MRLAQYTDQLGTAVAGAYGNDIPTGNIYDTVGGLIGVLLSVLGVIFLCLVIYSGFLWMTAQGDAKKVQTAKDILVQSVIGLVILMASWSISTFVLENVFDIGTEIE